MRKKIFLSLAAAGCLVSIARGNPYAASVISYNPGTGLAPGYTNTAAIVGPPSTADSYGDPVDPFDAAWQTNQLLSIGAGGWVVVEFDQPIIHFPNTTRDFIVFGNSFFQVASFSAPVWSATGAVASDGGQTRVSVSRDGTTFYALNSALAPSADYLYPTDGSGNFQLPVDPALSPTNFAGLTLAQIRVLYNGAAGGAGYSLAWAQDAGGNPASLPEVRFVRVDVLTNHIELGGFAAVDGTILTENFSTSPALNGWEAFGATNLFSWNSSQALNVTWDSSQTNSYYYHPLGTILTTNDSFSLSFDFVLNDATISPDAYQFELAIGFLNLGDATKPDFLRGTGDNATNLAEFDYFPPDTFGDAASLDATLIDDAGNYSFFYDDVPLLDGTSYHVTIQHAAGTSFLTGEVLTNGQIYTTMPRFYGDGTADFRLDTVAIASYSAAGSGGSAMLAHGIVKNVFVTAPPPPVAYLRGAFANGNWQAQFWSRTNWNYELEKSVDLQTWLPIRASVPGTGVELILTDSNAMQQAGFYRVSAYPQ